MIRQDKLGQRKDSLSGNSSVHKRGKVDESPVVTSYLRSSSVQTNLLAYFVLHELSF